MNLFLLFRFDYLCRIGGGCPFDLTEYREQHDPTGDKENQQEQSCRQCGMVGVCLDPTVYIQVADWKSKYIALCH